MSRIVMAMQANVTNRATEKPKHYEQFRFAMFLSFEVLAKSNFQYHLGVGILKTVSGGIFRIYKNADGIGSEDLGKRAPLLGLITWDLERALEDLVGLHRRDGNIADPENYEKGGGSGLESLGAAQLAASRATAD